MTPRVTFSGRFPTLMLKTGISANIGAICIPKNIGVRCAYVGCTLLILLFLVKPTFIPASAFVKVGSLPPSEQAQHPLIKRLLLGKGLVLPHFSGQFQKILLTSLRSQPDLR
ncbi:hypothetical protein, partial [uncultured Tateyamaria sp.]|uniref:hypothetical protein n=1 Tax=uncultured Tateyamaria sp. TaxID=455651 RepID=UPI002636C2E9